MFRHDEPVGDIVYVDNTGIYQKNVTINICLIGS